MRRGDRAALRDDDGVADRLGNVREQVLHRLGGLEPCFGRGFAAIVTFDVRRLGDAQHRVVRGVEAGFLETARISRDERQAVAVGEPDERGFGGGLVSVAATAQLEIKPVAEHVLEPRKIAIGGMLLPLRKHPRQATFAARSEAD